MRNHRLICAATAILVVAATSASAQQLGTISFPNSGSAAAQASFIRGMLLTHSFEYPTAAVAFREAQTIDPGFALAYAGEALTYTHPVWNQQDTAAALAALKRLAPTPAERRAQAKTPREQMYMDAVEALYGSGSKPKRDTLFEAAMERIVAAYPDDDEAKVFDAVALLGLNQSNREEVAYMRAGAIAEDVLRRNPNHPGAVHFVIHAFDDPAHAPLGLWAARAYSKIAGAAPHAQHMTTHIFLAMGMWDEVVSQNVIASGPDRAKWGAHHYTVWLDYGYLQKGQYDSARALLNDLHARLGQTFPGMTRGALASMRVAYLMTTEQWTDSMVNWSFAPIGSPTVRAFDAFGLGYAALKSGNRQRAEEVLAQLQREETAPAGAATQSDPRVIRVLSMEMRAALAAARGQKDSSVTLALEAARMEDTLPVEFGPPHIPKPTHELAGELLLAAGKPAEAQRQFARAQELAPGRARSLIGLARAAAKAGDIVVAGNAARLLLKNWHAGDASLPERAEMEKLAR